MQHNDDDQVQTRVIQWLERAVIGLNLCPFAKSVWVKQQVRLEISRSASPTELCRVLSRECLRLADADPNQHDTTLLIVPQQLGEFKVFNEFLDVADEILRLHGLDEQLQIESFHPDFQFEGVDPEDISNYTNRAPYPILHILRQDSMNRAVSHYPDTAAIYENNIQTLRNMGLEGWSQLMTDD